jgi:hypothetical protein
MHTLVSVHIVFELPYAIQILKYFSDLNEISYGRYVSFNMHGKTKTCMKPILVNNKKTKKVCVI